MHISVYMAKFFIDLKIFSPYFLEIVNIIGISWYDKIEGFQSILNNYKIVHRELGKRKWGGVTIPDSVYDLGFCFIQHVLCFRN